MDQLLYDFLVLRRWQLPRFGCVLPWLSEGRLQDYERLMQHERVISPELRLGTFAHLAQVSPNDAMEVAAYFETMLPSPRPDMMTFPFRSYVLD